MDRERQERWDAAHLRTASTKLLQPQYDLLRRACEAEGVTVYGLLRQLIGQWLVEFVRRNPDAAERILV